MHPTETETFAAEFVETISSIFETMLGVQVIPVERTAGPEANRVVASVHFTGSWSGVVIVEVSPEQACFLAGRFMSIEPPQLVDNDVRDVIGELANMIGGNLKSAVAPDATLSIPEVVDGGSFSLRICGGTAGTRQVFDSEGGAFCVSLIRTVANQNSGGNVAWTC
jgi:CheY-specific phosphatase CheX